MINRNLARIWLALAFAWSCGHEGLKSSRSLPSDVWAPGVFDQVVETVAGSVTHGGSENLTLWHALEVERLRVAPPIVLGDFRDALLVSTLSHFYVELPATEEPRKLVTAVRRTQAHVNKALHCEIFWTENQTLSSLIKLELKYFLHFVTF